MYIYTIINSIVVILIIYFLIKMEMANKAHLSLISVLILLLLQIGLCYQREELCETCINITEGMKALFRLDTVVKLYQDYDRENWCLKKYDEQLCNGFERLVTPHLYRAMISYINSDEICVKLGICKDAKYVNDTANEPCSNKIQSKSYEIRNNAMYQDTPKSESKNTSQKKLRFLVAADIHLDYDYVEV